MYNPVQALEKTTKNRNWSVVDLVVVISHLLSHAWA
jgi:hypothetical protein